MHHISEIMIYSLSEITLTNKEEIKMKSNKNNTIPKGMRTAL